MARNFARSISGRAVVLGEVQEAGPEVEAALLPVGETLVAEGLDLLVGRGTGRRRSGHRVRLDREPGPRCRRRPRRVRRLRRLRRAVATGVGSGWVWVMGGKALFGPCSLRRKRDVTTAATRTGMSPSDSTPHHYHSPVPAGADTGPGTGRPAPAASAPCAV